MDPTISYNLGQLTKYDVSDMPSVYKEIEIYPGTTENVEYKTVLTDSQLIQLGYCCEPKGNLYPIFIKTKDTFDEFKIGKSGMFEVIPETWIDSDETEEDDKEKIASVVITGVQVPANINFTLDYAAVPA